MNREIRKTKVWDPIVRIFHGSLVFFFFISLVTGDDFNHSHVVAGTTVLGLILFRAGWGFIGTQHARFSDFIFPPRTVMAYLKDLIRLRARRYIGHGPAGGTMVVALLISLLITTLSGLAVYGGQEYAGPFAGIMALADNNWTAAAKELHEFFAGFTLVLVCFHVAGVLFSSFAHRENLIGAIFTGYKQPEGNPRHLIEEDSQIAEIRQRRTAGGDLSSSTNKEGFILKAFVLLVAATMGLALPSIPASASPVDDLLAGYRHQGASSFSPQNGEVLWNKSFTDPASGEIRACANCHTADPRIAGKHAKTGKPIDAMAPSVNSKRLTDAAFIEKWFKRNCKWTLGRECTPTEKGNFLLFLKSQ